MSTHMLDQGSQRIIAVTLKRPMTIRQISKTLSIPIALCSKKVHMLKLKGFLKRKVVLDENDREHIYYQGTLLEENIPLKIKAPRYVISLGPDVNIKNDPSKTP